jgi:uncharacterized protein (DUF1330 family)
MTGLPTGFTTGTGEKVGGDASVVPGHDWVDRGAGVNLHSSFHTTPTENTMAAYVIADSNVHDPKTMKAYGAKVGETLKKYGGKVLVAGPPADVKEGDWTPKRMIVLEFADVDAAQTWYNSPEYQEILPIRLSAADDNFLIVEGV